MHHLERIRFLKAIAFVSILKAASFSLLLLFRANNQKKDTFVSNATICIHVTSYLHGQDSPCKKQFNSHCSPAAAPNYIGISTNVAPSQPLVASLAHVASNRSRLPPPHANKSHYYLRIINHHTPTL